MSHGLTVTPVPNAPFGAQITGVDLSVPLEPYVRDAIYAAWLDYQVVSFPDQPLTHPQFEALSQSFGEFGEEPYLRGMPEHPNLVVVERKADEKPSPFGTSWHTDWSFRSEPPAATLLHSKIVPPVGGDTLYASGYLAWEHLDQRLKARVEGLIGLHSARRSYSLAGYEASGGNARSMAIEPSDDAYAIERHPLVCTHPETGRKTLWVNWVYTIGLEMGLEMGLERGRAIEKERQTGSQSKAVLTDSEANELLRTLLEHSVREDFVYRHRWQPNMLVMWDNRCLQHQATGGYDGHRRLMHRATLVGTRPQA